MAYTDPPTVVAGGTALSAQWNAAVRDNFRSMGPHLIVRKPTDESVVSSVTYQDDDHLIIPVLANEVWHMEFGILFSGSATGDFKVGWNFPSSGSLAFSAIGDNDSAVTTFWPMQSTSPPLNNSLFAFNCLGVGLKTFVLLHGIYVNGGTAGNVTFQWAQKTSNATATVVHANSFARGAVLT